MSLDADAKNFKLDVTDREKAVIAQKIFHNECSRKKEKLTWWNKGEDFASLGLGHFIWYPKGYEGPFDESFVDFVAYLKKNSVSLPLWMEDLETIDCPWETRDAFFADFDAPDMLEFRDFLYVTFPYQVDFIVQRVEKSLHLILQQLSSPQKEIVYANFNTVFSVSGGVYALIDYINFKGEGIKKEERYKGEGWGLTQVLLEMDADLIKENPLQAFTDSAIYVLERRVANAPKERGENRWLLGWKNRVNTYINN